MSTIIWPAKLGGPRIERLGPARKVLVVPRAPRVRRGPGPLASAAVLFVVAVIDLAVGLRDWWDERRNTVYIERRP